MQSFKLIIVNDGLHTGVWGRRQGHLSLFTVATHVPWTIFEGRGSFIKSLTLSCNTKVRILCTNVVIIDNCYNLQSQAAR